MNEEEELDPTEKELREAQEQYDAENQQVYDEVTKGNEEIRRKRTEDDDEQLELPLESRNLARVGAGLAFEVGANSLLDALTLVPGTQAVGSALINTIAQGIRGGKFSFGEVLGSAAASQIPGLAQGKAITKAGRITRAAGTGAVSGAIEATSIAAVDEGRLPTAQEFGLGVGAGGVLGAGFQQAGEGAGALLQQIRKKVQNNTPITVYAASPSDSGFNLPQGDAEFKLRPETPFYRTLSPEAQGNLRKFARTNLNKNSWDDLGLAAKYEGTYDQGDWDRYLQTVLDQQDQTQFIIRMMNKIYTEQELKTGDLDEFGVRLADMFRLPKPVDKAGLQKIIRNEGGIIYLRTPRMRRNKIKALEVTNLQELQTAIEDRLADIATDPYFEYGHIRAVLNILQDNDAINNANFLGNFQAEPTRSIVRSLFRGKDLDELLDGPIDSVVEEFGNRATKAAADLDINVNRVEGTASNLEESFLNYMKPELDVANAVPVQLRQRLVDDYVAQVAEEGDDLAAYGINLNDPETPFNIDGINLAVFKDVLSKYKSGGVSLLQMLQVDEYVKLLRQFPEMAEEFLTTRPGSSGDFGINYLSNQKLTTEQKSLLASLRKKVNSLYPLKQSKKIKKKETEGGKFADPFRERTKPKKKFNKKKDDDNNNPPVTGSKPKK